jgi:hypothetical protein
VARKWVDDAETAIKQEQGDMRSAESWGLTSREPGETFEEMLDGIGDSLSDLASSDDGEGGENNEHAEQGELSADDETGWMMGTISKTVHYRLGNFRQKQIMFDEITQPGWEDAADIFRERDTN